MEGRRVRYYYIKVIIYIYIYILIILKIIQKNEYERNRQLRLKHEK